MVEDDPQMEALVHVMRSQDNCSALCKRHLLVRPPTERLSLHLLLR